MTNIDIPKLKTELKETAEEIKKLKAVLRESGQPNVTWRTHHELRAMKGHATVLCSLRANCRGKIHVRGQTSQEQLELIGDAWKQFEKPAVNEVAA